ncbi:DUF2505 domain-containing protein [Corynebacterium uberis]|uniref:DUF2505 domain-containing protein n=1 Tax=Corynebacterium TaxID=1716 RepID=UPI001D0A2B8B|nr:MULTISPECIES: DUF2505 domain-containing protein [Corynebacterium]MCZ9309543.1 DUF2505 domain-containing protein [Corynebacterium sp. c6VSa_13]UDL73088.1 DUF2505 domain-containing protein [Corynebacterium uberis]UDL76035.1 DUF2505 domain-containing protein [Corynebacterium uberis]UDL78247.1 DUF2505 domain-containing protein [Corynebacterium uberis]UDL80530.1 DUF2505 domain-containing protein [Corynebacterium uberis]
MTTRSENTVTVNQPLDKVHAALTNKDFWAYDAAHLSPEPGEVHEFTATDGGAEVTLFEVLPLEVLPEAVRSMVSQALKVKRVITVGALSDGRIELEYTADVKGTPVDYKGEATVSGTDTTTFDYEHEVTVAIPFMGGAIEPKVAGPLAEIFDNEARLLETWISENL